MSDQPGGTYTLVVDLPTSADIEVGALGTYQFDPGWYAYVGSALGPGGFSRIDRHRDLAAGERETRHWHVDYLLGHPESRLDSAVTTTGVDGECAVAAEVDAPAVSGFGCSDCACETHLYVASTRDRLLAELEAAHDPLAGATTRTQFR